MTIFESHNFFLLLFHSYILTCLNFVKITITHGLDHKKKNTKHCPKSSGDVRHSVRLFIFFSVSRQCRRFPINVLQRFAQLKLSTNADYSPYLTASASCLRVPQGSGWKGRRTENYFLEEKKTVVVLLMLHFVSFPPTVILSTDKKIQKSKVKQKGQNQILIFHHKAKPGPDHH